MDAGRNLHQSIPSSMEDEKRQQYRCPASIVNAKWHPCIYYFSFPKSYVPMEKRQLQNETNCKFLLKKKGDFLNKKRPKRDPKSGLGLLRDLG